jgi:hypothetical protein
MGLTLQGSSPLSQVVSMLEKTMKDLIDERTTKEKSFQKTSCLTKKTTEKNNELIKESQDRIADDQDEISMLGSVTLTDESQVLATKINDKKKEITLLVQDLEAKTQEHNAHMADLSAGTAALVDAEAKIVGGNFLQNKATILAKLSQKDKTLLESALADKQAPAAYESQVGAIKDLITNLKLQYQKEAVGAKTHFRKDEKAAKAMIQTANGELSTLQAEFDAGAGEAAAKAKRKEELQDSIDAANKAIADAKASNKEMSDMQTLHMGEWSKFLDDSSNQEAAVSKAIEILGNDEARNQFQQVHDDQTSFVQIAAQSMSGLHAKSAAIASLRSAIKDMKAELEEEKDNIIKSVNHCEKETLDLMEKAKETGEQMDGFTANILALEKRIESEQETQTQLTKEIAERMAERADAISVFEEKKAGLLRIKGDIEDANKFVGDAIRALQQYSYQASGKSDIYHEDDQTNPLAGVITMLQNIKSDFVTKAKGRQTEVDVATTEHNDYITKTGRSTNWPQTAADDATNEAKSAADGEKEEDPEKVYLKLEDQFVPQIVTPNSVIGDLEKERNASITAMNDAQIRLNSDTNSLNDNRKTLQGLDGKSGLMGSFRELQPGCDYWMINAPGRKNEIADEISALLSADTILSNQDLGMGSEDIAHIGSRQKGADAKDHEYAHTGSGN